MKRTRSTKPLNNLLKTSATVAVLGLSSLTYIAQAEEVDAVQPVEGSETATTATPEVNQEVTLAEAQASQALAQTEVETAQADVAQLEASVAQAQEQVAQDQQAVTVATEAVAQAQTELATAESIAAEATPEAIANTQTAVTEKTTALAEAKTAEATAQQAQAQQETVVTDKQVAVEQAQVAVAEAEQAVKQLETEVQDPEILIAEKANLDAQITDLESQLAVAQAELAQLQASAPAELAAQIAEKNAQITALEMEIDRLRNEVETVVVPGKDVMGGNTMVLNAGYPIAQIKELRDAGTPYQAPFNAVWNRVGAAVTAAATPGASLNTYQSIAADVNRRVDVNNMTREVQDELAIFAVTLLNSVRNQVGTSSMEVVAGAQEFSRIMARAYKANNGNTRPATAHDYNALAAAGAATGVNWQYENMAWYGGNSQTVDGIKRAIYEGIRYMLFTDDLAQQKYAHAASFFRESASGTMYLGVSTTTVGTYGTEHYDMIPTEAVTAAFDKTPVTAGSQTVTQTRSVDHSAKIAELQQQVSALATQVGTLQAYQSNIATYPSVASAQNRVDRLTTQLVTDRANSQRLAEQIARSQLSNEELQTRLTQARATLAAASGNLASAQSVLSTEQATLARLTEEAAAASALVAGLEQELAALETTLALYTNPNLVSDAQANLDAALLAQANAEAILAEDLATLVALQAELALAQTNLEEKLAVLAEATALVASLLPAEEVVATVPVKVTNWAHKPFKGSKAVKTLGTKVNGAAKAHQTTGKRSANKSLPNTGEATGLLALAGAVMANLGLVGLKRRQK